jgi:hypothetical protein
MIDERTLIEAYTKRCDELAKLLPKHAAAHKKFEELDNARLDMESDIARMRSMLEEMDQVAGSYHDQMAHDFSIDKYGRNRRYDEPRHGSMVLQCHCEVQCPLCKNYNVTLRYWRRRYETKEILKTEVEDGVERNGFYYCRSCGEELR